MGQTETRWRARDIVLRGHRFHRQTSIDNHIVDFYCAEKNLILEIDGCVHDFHGKHESDLNRQKYLENLGFKILRFTNEEVKSSIESDYLPRFRSAGQTVPVDAESDSGVCSLIE